MKPSKKRPPNPKGELTTRELLERRLILFVLAHTNKLGDAAEYLGMTGSTFYRRRKEYAIETPPRNSYAGPTLTFREMEDAFYARLAASVPASSPVQPVVPSLNLSFAAPAGHAGGV
jgi:hypothetical protein